MKALVSKKSIIIASVSLLVALVTLVSVNVFNSAGPVTGVASTITRPVRALASTVATTFGEIYAAIYRYEELEKRNEELLQLIAQREHDFRESVALAEENQELRALLHFRQRHSGYSHEPATFVSNTSDNWTSTFEINKGYSNSPVAVGMGVATEYGVLIGQVISVEATRSIVRTVIDTTFSASVFVGGDSTEITDSAATVKGDFVQMRNGLLILDHIDEDVNVLPGSTIVTSGQGGVFPPGLTVGEIVEVFVHTSGIGRYATVRPMRDIETIRNVFIILDFENPN